MADLRIALLEIRCNRPEDGGSDGDELFISVLNNGVRARAWGPKQMTKGKKRKLKGLAYRMAKDFKVSLTDEDAPDGDDSLGSKKPKRTVGKFTLKFTGDEASYEVGANLQGEYDFAGREVKPAVLTSPTGNEKWLPAAEVRGEGVFLELDDDAVRAWEARPAVQQRAEQLLRAFEVDANGDFPGVRFYLLHSLSHLLMTAVSLECGYAASAIRERIYCGIAEENGPNMAGVMLSTGTTGSEGTLGGLVEEGRRIRHHLREAWDLGRLCSNDPVCAAHDPSAAASDRRAGLGRASC